MASTVAADGLLLLHVPPAGVLPRLVVYPIHTLGTPVIAVGIVLTVIAIEVAHPRPVV